MESGYLLGSISAALSRAVTSPSAIVFVYEYHEVYPVDIFSNLKETLTYPESELLTPGVELGRGRGGGEVVVPGLRMPHSHSRVPQF